MRSLIRWYARGTDPAHYLALTAPVRGRIRVAALVQCCSAVFAFAALYFLWSTVVGITGSQEAPLGPWPSIWLSGAASVGASLLMFSAYAISHFADVKAQADIRTRILDTLGAVAMRWFITGSGGKTLDVVTAKVADIHAALAHGRLEIIYGIGLPLAGYVWLLSLDWRLALAALVPGVVVLVHAHLSAGAIDAERAIGIKRRADLVDAALEYTKDPGLTRALLHTRTGAGDIGTISRELETIYHRVIATTPGPSRWAQHLSDSLAILAGTVLLGGWMTLQGWLSATDLLAFVIVSGVLSAGLTQLQMARWALSNSYQAANEIAKLLSQPALSGSGAGDSTVISGAPAIEFDDVRFGYEDARTTIHDVSFTIERGTVTAIVGASGAGKSTIVSLLARFFDPSSGSIRISGVPLGDLSTNELYRRVGFVLQRPGIVTASIADNIRLGHPGAPDSQMHQAARQARIHERIMELPKAYDSIVGLDVTLSGGEAQRIALARTLLNAPDILILDEPTANVDQASEATLNLAIKEAMEGRTTVVISHRLRSITDADQILVFDRGRIVAAGTHDRLIESCDAYRTQWAQLPEDSTHASVARG